MVEAKDPPSWELTPSKFDRITNLLDVFGCVATYNTAIQANKKLGIHTTLPAVLRFTQQMLKTLAKGRLLKGACGIKVMVCQDYILQLKVFCILMVFALPLPADCKLYNGHDNDEH